MRARRDWSRRGATATAGSEPVASPAGRGSERLALSAAVCSAGFAARFAPRGWAEWPSRRRPRPARHDSRGERCDSGRRGEGGAGGGGVGRRASRRGSARFWPRGWARGRRGVGRHRLLVTAVGAVRFRPSRRRRRGRRGVGVARTAPRARPGQHGGSRGRRVSGRAGWVAWPVAESARPAPRDGSGGAVRFWPARRGAEPAPGSRPSRGRRGSRRCSGHAAGGGGRLVVGRGARRPGDAAGPGGDGDVAAEESGVGERIGQHEHVLSRGGRKDTAVAAATANPPNRAADLAARRGCRCPPRSGTQQERESRSAPQLGPHGVLAAGSSPKSGPGPVGWSRSRSPSTLLRARKVVGSRQRSRVGGGAARGGLAGLPSGARGTARGRARQDGDGRPSGSEAGQEARPGRVATMCREARARLVAPRFAGLLARRCCAPVSTRPVRSPRPWWPVRLSVLAARDRDDRVAAWRPGRRSRTEACGHRVSEGGR